MDSELKSLLWMVTVSLPVGLIAGAVLRWRRPDWCKRFAKHSLRIGWRTYALHTTLFTVAGLCALAMGHPYFSIFFFCFAGMQIFDLLRYGLRPIDPKMEERIDAFYGK